MLVFFLYYKIHGSEIQMKLYLGFKYCRLKIYINEITFNYGFSTVACINSQFV